MFPWFVIPQSISEQWWQYVGFLNVFFSKIWPWLSSVDVDIFRFPFTSSNEIDGQPTCRCIPPIYNLRRFCSTALLQMWIWCYICSQAATLSTTTQYHSTISRWQSYHGSLRSSAGRWNENHVLPSDSRFTLQPAFDYSSFISLSSVE